MAWLLLGKPGGLMADGTADEARQRSRELIMVKLTMNIDRLTTNYR
jgi:hypothetical protein